jgi:hypothetical protein
MKTRGSVRSRKIEHEVRRFEISVDDAARARVREPRQIWSMKDQRTVNGRPDRRDLEPREEGATGGDVHRQNAKSRAECQSGPDDRVFSDARHRASRRNHQTSSGRSWRSQLALQRDRVAAVRVTAEVHDSHAAAPQLAPDLVPVGQHGAGTKGG